MNNNINIGNSWHTGLVLSALLGLISMACANEPMENVRSFDENPIIGRWIIGQLAHATSEITEYSFLPNGTIQHGPTSNDSGFGDDYRTGLVAPVTGDCSYYCDFESPSCCLPYQCELGDRWQPVGDGILIELTCTDDLIRALTLSLDERLQPMDMKIDGEDAFHPGPDWEWVKCSDADSSCDAFFPRR